MLDKETERILSLVKEDMTDSEKALVIHDELAIMSEYSTSDYNKADIYNSLVEKLPYVRAMRLRIPTCFHLSE